MQPEVTASKEKRISFVNGIKEEAQFIYHDKKFPLEDLFW